MMPGSLEFIGKDDLYFKVLGEDAMTHRMLGRGRIYFEKYQQYVLGRFLSSLPWKRALLCVLEGMEHPGEGVVFYDFWIRL